MRSHTGVCCLRRASRTPLGSPDPLSRLSCSTFSGHCLGGAEGHQEPPSAWQFLECRRKSGVRCCQFPGSGVPLPPDIFACREKQGGPAVLPSLQLVAQGTPLLLTPSPSRAGPPCQTQSRQILR